MTRVMVLFFLFLTLPVQGSRQDSESDAVGVWEKVLAAKGGKERLHTITSVLRSSRHSQSLKGRSCRECPVERISRETASPEAIAEHRDAWRSNSIVVFCDSAAQSRRYFETVKIVSADQHRQREFGRATNLQARAGILNCREAG